MKRIRTLVLFLSTLSLLIGAAAAQADGSGGSGSGDGSGDQTHQVVVTGTIQSVNTTAGTFTAQAYLLNASGEGAAPTLTSVTIATDSGTAITVDGSAGTVAGLSMGQTFYAAYNGSSGESLTALVANPAQAVDAFTPVAYVAGTIVSVDATAGTFTANAYVVQSPGSDQGSGSGEDQSGGSSGGGDSSSGSSASFGSDLRSADTAPTTTLVTITTGSATKFEFDGESGKIGDLAAGQRFVARFKGASSDSLATLIANPALSVVGHSAEEARAQYAFVGTVTAVDTTSTPETVTVLISQSSPSGLVPSGASAQTFTVGPDTFVLGGSGASPISSSLSNVSVGDTVAGGLVAASGLTLAQVEADPLKVLIDLPAATTGTTSTATTTTTTTTTSALKRALSLLKGKKTKAKAKHAKTKKSKKTKKSHKHVKHA